VSTGTPVRRARDPMEIPDCWFDAVLKSGLPVG